MTNTLRERFINLAAGEHRPTRVPLPPLMQVKASAQDTEGRLSLLEVTLVRDIPRHVHEVSDEMIYILEGVLAVHFDGEDLTVPAGSFILLPHGVPHAIGRAAENPPRVLQMSSPGGWECFMEDLAEAGPAVRRADGSLDPASLNPIAARHHIRYEA